MRLPEKPSMMAKVPAPLVMVPLALVTAPQRQLWIPNPRVLPQDLSAWTPTGMDRRVAIRIWPMPSKTVVHNMVAKMPLGQ